MAQIGDILAKLGRRETLTTLEQQQIRLWGNNTEFNNAFVDGLQNGRSNIQTQSISSLAGLPVTTYFSKALEKDTASIAIDIPTNCNHLMVYASGRIDQNAGGSVWMQFNSDTASNYSYYYIRTDGTTVTTGVFGGQSKVFVGSFAVSTAGANIVGTLRADVMDIQSTFYNSIISQSINNGYGYHFTSSGDWRGTGTIKRIEIFATDGSTTKGSANLVAGSVVSVYGLL